MRSGKMSCVDTIYSEDVYDFIIRNSYYLEGYSRSACSIDINGSFTLEYVDRDSVPFFSIQNQNYGSVPKCYATLGEEALEATGIPDIRSLPAFGLEGKGVLMGFIDTGIDYQNPLFLNEAGQSRIAAIWDQTIRIGSDSLLQPPYGTVYTQAQLNMALASDSPLAIVPSVDETGHGTYVASIAAGNNIPEDTFSGGAPGVDIAMVKCKPAKRYLTEYAFIDPAITVYQENDIMMAVQFLDRLAIARNQPLVICIAMGTSFGSHGGTSPLCTYLNEMAPKFRRCVVTATGNEANAGHHFYGSLTRSSAEGGAVRNVAAETVEAEIQVGENVPGFVMEQWAQSPELYHVAIISPSGELFPASIADAQENRNYRFLLEGTQITVNERIMEGISGNQLIFYRFVTPASGIWRVRISLRQGTTGSFHLFLPMSVMLQGQVYFLRPNPDTTLLSPSDALRVISAGGYNDANNSLYLSSGRGFTLDGNIKPDFVAPAVDVTGAANVSADRPAQLRYLSRSGTSASAAFTASAAALAMEWFAFREGSNTVNTTLIKNFLIRGCATVPNELFPNRAWGYGIMDLYQSFLNLR